MNEQAPPPPPPPVAEESAPQPPLKKEGKGCFFYGCLSAIVLLLVIVATAGVTAWMVKRSLNPKPIEPTVLTAEEQQVFDEKIEIVMEAQDEPPVGSSVEAAAVEAGTQVLNAGEEVEEDEDFIRKPLVLTERELNSIISKNTDLADKVYVSLRRNRIQFKGNFPVPDDLPLWGGRTIRINVRNRLELVDGRLELRMENIALGGIPVPSAWIQDIKGKDLLSDVFADDDFVRALSEGVESLEVENGQIVLMLAE